MRPSLTMTLIEKVSVTVRQNGVGKLNLAVTTLAEETYPYDDQAQEHPSIPLSGTIPAIQVILQTERGDGIQRRRIRFGQYLDEKCDLA